MKLKYAQALAKTAQESDLELELREEYSGRSMYGNTTAAVVGSNSTLLECVAIVAREIDEEDYDDFLKEISRIRRDSMGKYDEIFY